MDFESFVLKPSDIRRLTQMIGNAEHIVITAHMSPDGDAVGSSMALAHLLTSLGRDVAVIYPDAPAEYLRFLTKAIGYTAYCEQKEFADELFQRAQLIFCLDYNAPKRIDMMQQALLASKAPKALIDHHLDPEPFCNLTISDPKASSTCLLLFKTICALELLDAIDEHCATALLAGMMTDTGNFSFGNAASPELYNITAFLMERGAKRLVLVKKLFDTFSADCLRLNAYAICHKMDLWEDKGAALITLTRDEVNSYHYKPGYTEGLVNKPLAIEKVQYSIFLREESDYIKVSMRSKGSFPCNIICQKYFNGGGHLNAAGGEFYGSMQQAIDIVHSILDENYNTYIKKQR